MNRFLLVSAVLSSVLVTAQAADWELTPVAGMVFPDKDTHLEDQTVIGGELQYNGFGAFFAPELQVLQSLETDFDAYPGAPDDTPPYENGSTYTNRIAVNAVHDFDTKTNFYPFFKLGAGYESFHDYHYFENEDGVYANAGLGAKYFFTDMIALKLEGLAMHRFNKRDDLSFDNNFALLAGITFAFGGSEKEAASADESASAEMAEEAAAVKATDAALQEAQAKAAEEAAARAATEKAAAASAAAAAAALANADDDGDGVRNADDLCAHTPAGMSVDAAGCALPPKTDLTFALNAAKLSDAEKKELEGYADFLKRTGNRVRVIGHTDNSGPERFNEELSLKRAQSAADVLIKNGVPAQNIEIAGRGASEPLMSNATPEGRAANRRVELHLLR